MADNIKVLGSGVPGAVDVATDVISGVHYPIYKVSWGVDGTQTPVSIANPLPSGIYGSAGTLAYVDEFSGAIGVIEQEHLKIHEGKGFTLAVRLTIANVGGTHEFLGVVPAFSFPHFRNITVASDGGPVDVDFYEAPTYSVTGSTVTPFNNNRNSSTTANLAIYDAPTLTDDGVLLEPILIPGTKQSGSLGSEGSNEWNLKQGEDYMIRVTNNTVGAGTSRFTINMFWYE